MCYIPASYRLAFSLAFERSMFDGGKAAACVQMVQHAGWDDGDSSA